ncbi:MAG: glutamine amidotransferase [Patescibacteria group bacterium]|nr:glutamine amidotransferase [Patescibacteria group bacterium]
MNYKLTIGWLYPKLMSTYGDRGNVIVLQKRCEWRKIETEIKIIDTLSTNKDLSSCDLLMMGGAQDTQQEIVAKDLKKKKSTFKKMIEDGTPGLYICGGFQYLGRYYKTAQGNKLPQLEVLDMYTENPGRERLIGNIAIDAQNLFEKRTVLVGFENHGGRTIPGDNIKPLGRVLRGFGSNDISKEEGALYKNTIGTYLHGPILSKNPVLADYLIEKALELKYKTDITLEMLDDSLEEKARMAIAKRLQIAI